jgi:hypothetical protein
MSSLRHNCQLSAVTAVALIGLPVAAAVAQGEDQGRTDFYRERLVLSEASIKGLTESLAVANGETELFKRKADDINARIESLGVSPSGKEEEALRTRLIAAVRDMRLLQKENDSVREKLVLLSESVMELLKSSEGINADARLKVEENLRTVSSLLNKQKTTSANAPGLTSGSVVDVKPDLSLVVANLGSRQGVKNGMPFQVWRGDKQIASVRVVDVRDALSGAIVQNTINSTEPVRAGDTLRIDTTR